MWPYWILFLIPAIKAVSNLRQSSKSTLVQCWSGLWLVMYFLLALMIGFRHEVGGDWSVYLENMNAKANLTLADVLAVRHGDPADNLFNWLAVESDFGIYFVNSAYGLLFSFGLIIFCRNQPRPWLAITVAVPYLITVVAMGYSRQGVAIGLAMLALVALENKRVLKFLLWIALASTFHKSAVILVTLALLAGTKRRLFMLIWIAITAILLFNLLLQEYIDVFYKNYIGAEYESSGASIRIAMNALPAVLFLIFRKRFQLSSTQRSFWTWMSWGALLFVILLYISPSSTAVDRVALYWIPLQLFVWSRIPDALGHRSGANVGWVYAVVVYSALVHFVWLFFAQTAFAWLPYQFYPWVWLWN
jgi:hypothetical protein